MLKLRLLQQAVPRVLLLKKADDRPDWDNMYNIGTILIGSRVQSGWEYKTGI